MIIVLFIVILYFIVILFYNVMNVIVIEEFGGYNMIVFCLDMDFCFINFVIED